MKYLNSKAVFIKFSLTILLTVSICKANAQILPGAYSTSWVGNTFVPATKSYDFVQGWANSMFVDLDGTIYANSFWDEGGKEMGIYKNGKCIGSIEGQHENADGGAITANSTFVWGTTNNGGIRKFNKTDYKQVGNEMTVSNSTIRGLAASTSELFVSDYVNNLVKSYNITTGAISKSWSVTRPGPMALDAIGNVWVLCYDSQSYGPGTGACIKAYNRFGTLVNTITLVEGVEARSISIDKVRNELLVTDISDNMQVHIYNNIDTATPKFLESIGTKGGILSGTKGLVQPLKFNVPTLAGTDSNGNIVVWSNGNNPDADKTGGVDTDGLGSCIESYTRSGTLNWQMLGLHFVDLGTFDPTTDGTDFYTKHEHFTMDYSKPDGQQWIWKGWTVDRKTYATSDDRLKNDLGHLSTTYIRVINGQKFMFLTSMTGGGFSIYRFGNDEILIPCGELWGQSGWSDYNANGLRDVGETTKGMNYNYDVFGVSVDDEGSIWYILNNGSIRKHIIQSITNGVPIYNTTTATTITAKPAPFYDIRRVQYDSKNDKMYLSGYTIAKPYANDWKSCGTVFACYNNWSTGNRIAQYTITLPSKASGEVSNMVSTVIEKDYIFVVGVETRSVVYVYKSASGEFIGKLEPGSNIGGVSKTGWCDLVNSISAFKRSNGEYLISVEEDGWMKVVLYRWDPTSAKINITGVNVSPSTALSLTVGSTTQFTATVLPNNATNKAVTWSSSNTAVATVDATGKVTIIKLGLAFINATSTDGGKIGTAFVKVGPSYPVSYTSTAVTIDGLLTESEWTPNSLINKVITGTANNEGKFSLLWDNNYLYVGTTVKDAVIKSFPNLSPWLSDGIEFYIDGNQNKGSVYDAYDIQIVRGVGTIPLWTSKNAVGIKSAVAIIAEGYSVEMAIPWSVIKAVPVSGLGLGFNIAYNDNDTGNRDAILVWQGNGDSFTNTSSFDDLILMPPNGLPLNLVSFTAKLKLNKVSLNWETKNEVNVRHIEVERCSDGINFETISIVPSTGGGFYITQDDAPLKGNNYYRLKTVDNDGKFEISGTQVVNFSLDNTIEFSIYPNPNNGKFTISPSQSKIHGTVTIFDQQGRKMLRREILGTSSISVDNLTNGVYLIQLNTGGLIEVKKMVKE